MKNTRLALIITFTPPDGAEITDTTTPEDLKLMLHEAAGVAGQDFVEDVAIWQTMKGSIEEDELQDDSIDKLDRSIIHQMSVDQAKVILTSRQTIEAMLMMFGQLSAATLPGTDLQEADIEDGSKKSH